MTAPMVLAAVLLLAGASSAQFTTETEEQKLLPLGYQNNDGIGNQVAAGGDWLCLSAIGDSVTEGQQGSVHVYRWSGARWVEDGLIVASQPSGFAQFGKSLALSGDTLIVGAPRQDNPGFFNQGMAYAFQLQGETWVEEQQLFPTGLPVGDFYADQVALGGGRAFILGDLLAPLDGPGIPTIFVFQRTPDGWVQEPPFQPEGLTNGEGNYEFMAATDDHFFMGLAYADGPAGLDEGAVLIFERDGDEWVLTTTLYASDASAGDRFGTTLELEGDRLAVGAPVKSFDSGDLRGAVYVFRQEADTWVEELASGTQIPPHSNLGGSVELEGSLLFAGAGGYDSLSGSNVGAVFAWHRAGTTWTPLGQFVATDGDGNDLLGNFIATSGPMVVAGAPNDGPPLSFDVHGSGYSFDALSQGWSHRGGSSAGVAGHPVLTAFGKPVPGSVVTLELQRAAPAAPVFLLAGFSAVDLPFKGGVLVPFPQILLGGMGTNAAGELIVSGHWPALPSGATLYVQDWIVDASAASGLAGSNGVAALVP